MDIWKETGISSKNTTDHACFEEAFLLVQANNSILKKKFPYETTSNEMYQETSGIIGEFTTKSKTIFTPFYWLPFCKGARVQMSSGEMTIKDVVLVQDSKKAQGDGKGVKGLTIVF